MPRRNARPPIPVPGIAGCRPPTKTRPTVRDRPVVRPRLWTSTGGYPADHSYVRRYWTAAIGAGAVADLLRLIQAAKRQLSIRRPVNTPALARSGLIIGRNGQLYVRSTVPPLPGELLRRLPPALRQEIAQLNGNPSGSLGATS